MANWGKLLKSFRLGQAVSQFDVRKLPSKFPSLEDASGFVQKKMSDINRSVYDREEFAREQVGADEIETIRPAPVFGSKWLTNNPVSRWMHPSIGIAESEFSPTARKINSNLFDQTYMTVGNTMGIPNKTPTIESQVIYDMNVRSADMIKQERDLYTQLSVRRAGQRQEKVSQTGYLWRRTADFMTQGLNDQTETLPRNLSVDDLFSHMDDILDNGIKDNMVVRESDFLELADYASYRTVDEIKRIKDPELKEMSLYIKQFYKDFFEQLSERGLIFDPRKASDEEIAKFLEDEMEVVFRDEAHKQELIDIEKQKGAENLERYIPRIYLQEAVRRGRGVFRDNLYKEWWPQRQQKINVAEDDFTIKQNDEGKWIVSHKNKRYKQKIDELFESFEKKAEAKKHLREHLPNIRETILERITEIENDRLLNQIDDTIDTILHDPLGVETRFSDKLRGRDPKGESIKPRALHSRKVMASEKALWPFIERNPIAKMRRYMRSVLPEIYMADMFPKEQYPDGFDDIFRQIKREYREARRNVESGSLEERRITKEERQVINNLRDMLDRLKGINTKVGDPSSAGNRVRTSLLKYNTLKYMPQASVAQVGDMGVMVARWGMEPFAETLAVMGKNLDQIKATKEDYKMLGIWSDIYTSTRIEEFAGIDPNNSIGGEGVIDAMEGSLDTLHGYFGTASGMNWINTNLKFMTGLAVQHELIKDALKIRKGLDVNQSRINRYAYMGLDKNDLIKIANEFDKPGMGEIIDGSFHLANASRWEDEALSRRFILALQKEVDSTILTDRIGNTPLVRDTAWGSVILQFRTHQFNAAPTLLMANLQNPDLNFARGLVAMTFFGFVSYYAKQKINGYPVPWDRPQEILLNSIDRSGIHAYLLDANMILERASGGNFGIGPMLGGSQISRYAQRDIVGTLLGPSYKTAEDIFFSFQGGANLITGQPVEPYQQHAAWKNIPMMNAPYIRGVFTAIREAAGTDDE